MDLLALLPSWERHLRAENKAPTTIRGYLTVARALGASLTGVEARSVKRQHVETYLASRLASVSPTSVHVEYRALGTFFRWCLSEKEITRNPMNGIKPPILPEKPVPILSDRDIEKLLNTCAKPTFTDRRDQAMIRILLDTGMRRAELVGITLNDIDFEERTIRITGKFRRTRVVPFGNKTAQSLDRYLRSRAQHKYADLPNLWLSTKGAMNGNGIYQLIQRKGEQAGIKVYVHQMRHTFSHNWLLANGSETDLMRINGWKSRDMLQRYGASAADHRAREAHRRLGIGDRY